MFSLADAIIEERFDLIGAALQRQFSINEIDEYGFTPLIEAAIADSLTIAELMIQYGADVNQQDMTGNTALHWAAENNNLKLVELLLKNNADPNAYNFAGQPVLTMPLLRQQEALKKLLMSYGAELIFAQDFINTKLLGHMFELVGTADILDTHNQFVEVDFEGFYLEFTLNLIAESLAQFNNHFAARKLRHYSAYTNQVIQSLLRAAQLIKFQQYRIDTKKHLTTIHSLLQQEPLIIPVGYEGHAITFIKFGNLFVKCDRREDSRLYDNIVFYRIHYPAKMNVEFVQSLIYEKQTDYFINQQVSSILGLEPITELKVTAQVSGNCSWANVEACIPAVFFLLFSQIENFNQQIAHYKSLALNYFHQWQEWNKERALQFCIKSFYEANVLRRACKAEILSAILYQCCQQGTESDNKRIQAILPILMLPEYVYILQNYVVSYCYHDHSTEGQRFLRMLKRHGYVEGR